jgi:glyoxylase-like metal-dependent hydrolase (beta-lactamase superfamily II)
VQIETFPAGPIETNAYLVADEEAGEAWVIDAPPESARIVLDTAKERGWTITALIDTHGHWDHIVDNAAIRDEAGVPIFIHPADEPMITRPTMRDPSMPPITPTKADRYLNDGDTLTLGKYTFTVWHTPGHSPGGIVLYEPTTHTLIGGDTLFPNGHGTIDIPGADKRQMYGSLARLATLPPETTVYPGHGAPTTIGAELPWMQALSKSA